MCASRARAARAQSRANDLCSSTDGALSEMVCTACLVRAAAHLVAGVLRVRVVISRMTAPCPPPQRAASYLRPCARAHLENRARDGAHMR